MWERGGEDEGEGGGGVGESETEDRGKSGMAFKYKDGRPRKKWSRVQNFVCVCVGGVGNNDWGKRWSQEIQKLMNFPDTLPFPEQFMMQ